MAFSDMWSKSFYLFVLAFILTGITGGGRSGVPKSQRWIICASSSLMVNGSTNFSRFSCLIDKYRKSDTLTVDLDGHTNKFALLGGISMDIAGFDCKNRLMTSELRKTLKQDRFPEIIIDFLAIDGLPKLQKVPAFLNGVVQIEIAGIKKRFDISYSISIDRNKVINLVAVRDVNFSDFNLLPPKKMGNLVQAKNRLGVVLSLKMREI